MADNRTTELREKLTESGVKWRDESNAYVKVTTFTVNGIEWNAIDYFNSEPEWMILRTNTNVTPEQAIAATLGSERELIDLAHNAWSMALCAMQGMPIPAEWGDAVERGLREHGIDVDGELAGFEVID